MSKDIEALIERLRNPVVTVTQVDGVAVPSMYDYEMLLDEAAELLSSLREENESLRNAFEMSAQESSEVIIALQQENERLRKERDEALAEIDSMTPKFVAYEYLESPAGREIAETALSASQAQLKIYREALEPMKEVLRISDRKHPAWDAVRNAIASIEAHTALSQGGGGMKLTKVQRDVLEMFPVYLSQEISEQRLRSDGAGLATLWSLEASDLIVASKYANGRFWRITDAGRAALSQNQEQSE